MYFEVTFLAALRGSFDIRKDSPRFRAISTFPLRLVPSTRAQKSSGTTRSFEVSLGRSQKPSRTGGAEGQSESHLPFGIISFYVIWNAHFLAEGES